MKLAKAWASTRPSIQAVYEGYKTTAGIRLPIRSAVFVVTEKKPMYQVAVADRIPASIDGLPTDVLAGTYHALNTTYIRPCPAGYSIGHRDITAGTFGLPVKRGTTWLALTNNHVAANSNAALIGDSILQPGPHDGGTLPAWGTLDAFHPIKFEASRNLWQLFLDWLLRRQPPPAPINYIDAAICQSSDIKPEVAGLGPATGVHYLVDLDQPVQKVGRTTGHTKGYVVGINGYVRVGYGNSGNAAFDNQIILEGYDGAEFSAGGDSGSAILTPTMKVVGLLFAGGGNQTIANPIADVLHVWPDLRVL